MGEIVFAQPYAWDKLKKEHIYYTDAIQEYPTLDFWYANLWLGTIRAQPGECEVSCCAEYQDRRWSPIDPDDPDNGSFLYGCPGYYPFAAGFGGEYYTTQKEFDGREYCCPDKPCDNIYVKSIIGTFSAYIASSKQDQWIEIVKDEQINQVAQLYDSHEESMEAYKNANLKSELVASINMSAGDSAIYRESFKALDECTPPFRYEDIYGAENLKANASENYSALGLGVSPTGYGLYILVVGEIETSYGSICNRPPKPSEKGPAYMVLVTSRESRLSNDHMVKCNQNSGADCTKHAVMYPDLPPLFFEIGASGPSGSYGNPAATGVWLTEGKFRERALFSSSLFTPHYLDYVRPGGRFKNPWNPNKMEDVDAYGFVPYNG